MVVTKNGEPILHDCPDDLAIHLQERMFCLMVQGMDLSLKFTDFSLQHLPMFGYGLFFAVGQGLAVFLSQRFSVPNRHHTKAHRIFFKSEASPFGFFTDDFEKFFSFFVSIFNNFGSGIQIFMAFKGKRQVSPKALDDMVHGLFELSPFARSE